MKHTMTLEKVVATVVNDIRTKGVGWTAHACFHELRELLADRRFGLNTWGTITLDNIDIPAEERPHANHYEPTPLNVIDKIFRVLHEVGAPYRDFAFVDLGSGKGRAILKAAQLPFKRVVGVEISSSLHEVTLRNVERMRRARKILAPLECVHGDATQFVFPAKTVLYMYHPFDEHVLRQVLANLRMSLAMPDSVAYVVYVYPCQSQIIGSLQFLKRIYGPPTDSEMNAFVSRCSLDPPFEIWCSSQLTSALYRG